MVNTMKSIEALECMRDGTQVALYWPDCEMFEWAGTNTISLSLPDYHGYQASTITTADFLKYYTSSEFVIYEKHKSKT
jgi:hypothetical protein